jgi:hypothetical protein
MSTTETEYQLGVPVEDAVEDGLSKAPVHTGTTKQGHKCCGGCCDVRRAVIIINLVTIAMTILALMGSLSLRQMDSGEVYPDDDVNQANIAELTNAPLGVMIAHVVIKIILSTLGVLGAMKFNMYMVGLAAASYFFDMVLGFIGLSVIVVVTQALFLYPHFFLIKEIREGIMSKENYPVEKQSCCCV